MNTPPLPALALALALLGCSSDTKTTSGSNVDPGKKLSDLSIDERQSLCASNLARFEGNLIGSCTLAALGSPTKAACATARDQCKSEQTSTSGVCVGPDASVLDFSACTTIDVGQVESCLATADSFFAGLSCDTVGAPPPTLPGCLGQIQAGCPALLNGGM